MNSHGDSCYARNYHLIILYMQDVQNYFQIKAYLRFVIERAQRLNKQNDNMIILFALHKISLTLRHNCR